MLVDIDLGAESGLDVVERLAGAALARQPRMILISTHAEADFAELIDASPALGFVFTTRTTAAGRPSSRCTAAR